MKGFDQQRVITNRELTEVSQSVSFREVDNYNRYTMHKKLCYLHVSLCTFVLGLMLKLNSFYNQVHKCFKPYSCRRDRLHMLLHDSSHKHQVMILIFTCLITHNFTSITQSLFKEQHIGITTHALPTIQLSHQQIIIDL